MSGVKRWWVVMPLKDTRHAKSRLQLSPGRRRAAAVAMARDTLAAVLAAYRVGGVIVVCGGGRDAERVLLPGARALTRPRLPLDDAIRAGADFARAIAPDCHLAALPADLPHLDPTELDTALGSAERWKHACVADRDGTGTTLLTTRAPGMLEPAYGTDSLERHRAQGAHELAVPDWSGLRRDVDLPQHLCIDRSLGHHSRYLLQQSSLVAVGGAQ